MKKKIVTVFLSMVMIVSFASCSNDKKDTTVKTNSSANSMTDSTTESTKDASAESADQASEQDGMYLTGVSYVTVTEGFDWGPAITKLILNMGTTMDGTTLTKDSFKVSSVREYMGFDFTTMVADTESKAHAEERAVTAAYISDSSGKEAADGTYVMIEMQIGPDITAGSPFNYDFASGLNSYVDTSYIVELNSDAGLKTAEGKLITMAATDKVGYQGNISLIADDFDLNGTYTNGDITLKYASYTPATASIETARNPLIIWLHGAGEGGTDPRIAILGNKVVNLTTPGIQSYFGDTGAYILAPQTPTMWMDYDGKGTYTNSVEGSNGKSYYTETLMGLIEDFVTSHPEIDPNRIYIGGCSNGGYMTMNMITTYPGYFAAAYPVCEAYSDAWLTEEKLSTIADLPIWFTHAKTDSTVAIYQGTYDYMTSTFTFTLNDKGEKLAITDFTNAAYDRLITAGATNVHYSLFENVVDTSGYYFRAGTTDPYEYMGHWSWIYTLNNQCEEEINGKKVTIFEWLAQQSKH